MESISKSSILTLLLSWWKFLIASQSIGTTGTRSDSGGGAPRFESHSPPKKSEKKSQTPCGVPAEGHGLVNLPFGRW